MSVCVCVCVISTGERARSQQEREGSGAAPPSEGVGARQAGGRADTVAGTPALSRLPDPGATSSSIAATVTRGARYLVVLPRDAPARP